MVSLCKEGMQCPVLRGVEDGVCDVKAKLYLALCSYFKFDEFRPGQLESLVPVLHGKDVFIRLATGSGKSLCMFLAPLAGSGSATAVIVSPLNGLMDEQVSLCTIIRYRGGGVINPYVYWTIGTHWNQCSTCDSKRASRQFRHRKVLYWYGVFVILIICVSMY